MKCLNQDLEQQYRHEEKCLLNHVVGVNSELDVMVLVALWNNIEAAFVVAVEVAEVEVVATDEEMKTVDFVHMVEIGSTHQNGGSTS